MPADPTLKHSNSPEGTDIHAPEAKSEQEKDVESTSASVASFAVNSENASAGEKETPQSLDWDGPDDPDDPMNWPVGRKVYSTLTTGLMSFAVTFGTSVYAPGVFGIEHDFGVSRTAALLGLSVYTVALGVAPVLAAPLSETHGRVIVYWISGPLFMLFTLGAGYSQTLAQLLVCRFLAGVFGSPVMAVGPGTISDIWETRVRAVSGIGYILSPFLGPAFAPIVGGYLALTKGWRWTQWVLIMLTLVFYIMSLFMKESYKPIVLARRARRRGIEVKSSQSRLALLKLLFTVTLVRPVHMLLTEPVVMFLTLYSSFSFGVLFAFFDAFPIVFQGVYGFNIGQAGLPFLAVGLGVILGAITGVVIDRVIYQKKYREAIAIGKSRAVPEHRLYPAMLGSFGLPVALFWFGWSARPEVHWISCILSAVPFAWGNILIFMSGAVYIIDTYGPLVGASAIAANGLGRYGFAAAFPLFTVQMYDKLGPGWATSVFGFASVCMLPVPWVLFKWGPKIRARSGYDTIKD